MKPLFVECDNLAFVLHYNTVKPNLKEPADLLRFRDSFGLKKAKI